MSHDIVDISVAGCLIALAVVQRESHWFWVYLSTAGGMLVGMMIYSFLLRW
jgi:hypothetical protein